MNDAEKPKHKFWQFQLSTALLSMLLAGWLLGAQFHQKFSYDDTDWFPNEWLQRFGWIEQGWPFPLYQKRAIIVSSRYRGYDAEWELCKRLCNDYVSVNGIGFATPLYPREKKVSLLGTILDFLVAALILVGVAVVYEWRIRRREARKT
jgi:hypothetical protein